MEPQPCNIPPAPCHLNAAAKQLRSALWGGARDAGLTFIISSGIKGIAEKAGPVGTAVGIGDVVLSSEKLRFPGARLAQ